MNKLLISAGALAALALSTPALAAPSNQASASATVNIVSPLTLTLKKSVRAKLRKGQKVTLTIEARDAAGNLTTKTVSAKLR